jgi:hypothetical protein
MCNFPVLLFSSFRLGGLDISASDGTSACSLLLLHLRAAAPVEHLSWPMSVCWHATICRHLETQGSCRLGRNTSQDRLCRPCQVLICHVSLSGPTSPVTSSIITPTMW